MATEEMPWRDAILRVLEEAQEPLDTPTITKQIGKDNYRKLTGETPSRTVSSYISVLKKEGVVIEPKPYYYALKGAMQTVIEIASKNTLPQPLTVQAYGLYWELLMIAHMGPMRDRRNEAS